MLVDGDWINGACLSDPNEVMTAFFPRARDGGTGGSFGTVPKEELEGGIIVSRGER